MKVLVADDNRDAVQTLSLLLNEEGHEVASVYEGWEVLAAVRAFDPDAVLLDIKMPGLSGYDVARLIRRRYGCIRPVLIAISGHRKQGSDQIIADLVGFDHHFPKPCDPKALLELLKL